MSLFDIFRKREPSSAEIAKERLQIIVAHSGRGGERKSASPDFLPQLQKDILEVVQRYFPISEEQIDVSLQTKDDCEVLDLNITIEQRAQAAQRRPQPQRMPPRNPPRNPPRTSF